ncbi:MAG: phosphate ABC transporter permease subunit PstC [Hyphomicrobiales bacterium]|nr:MAG: phosphate ABC transporter permease subunit PstC [Hyphomicrobiales bacterium]
MTAATDMTSIPGATPIVRKTPKATFDLVFRNASFAAALLVLVLLAAIMASMVIGGWPAFREFGLGFITSSVWDTQNEQYGAWPAIVGTLSTALIALVIGVPLSLGIAVYLTQLAPAWFKKPVSTAIELLAAVPSIIYGMWGVRHVLVPQAGVSIIGAVMLGLGRALGETMAVTFVVGNANRLSASILDPGSTIASRIANEFNEAMGLQLNALIALGCILFFVTFVVLVIARLLVARVKRY